MQWQSQFHYFEEQGVAAESATEFEPLLLYIQLQNPFQQHFRQSHMALHRPTSHMRA